MSDNDDLDLVEDVLELMEAENDGLVIPQSLRQELDRRIAAADSDPDGGSPWEQVLARLMSRKPGNGR